VGRGQREGWWKRIVPGVAFDAPRYRLLRGLNVQETNWTPDLEVGREVFMRYQQERQGCLGAQSSEQP
jgi:hypothetical protein